MVTGAGPVGLLKAQRLKIPGTKSTLFEREPHLNERPRDWRLLPILGAEFAHRVPCEIRSSADQIPRRPPRADPIPRQLYAAHGPGGGERLKSSHGRTRQMYID